MDLRGKSYRFACRFVTLLNRPLTLNRHRDNADVEDLSSGV
jgi:hypothetical protein